MKRVIVNVDVNVIAVMTMMDADFIKTSLTFRDIAEMYMKENHPENQRMGRNTFVQIRY